MLIATHDGTFHADETTACAIISYLYDNFRVIRSRDPETIEKADLVIDVSLKNDQKHFDHHSKEFTKCRPNGVRYATAGLMWEKFGIDFLKRIVKKELPFRPDQSVIDSAFDRIDREMMVMVDLVDNGQLTDYSAKVADARTEGEIAVRDRLNAFYQGCPDISYIVSMQNLPGLSREAQDQAFMGTVKILRQILVAAAINAITTESGIAKVIKLPRAALLKPPDRACGLARAPGRGARCRDRPSQHELRPPRRLHRRGEHLRGRHAASPALAQAGRALPRLTYASPALLRCGCARRIMRAQSHFTWEEIMNSFSARLSLFSLAIAVQACGITLVVKSALGTSPISTLPYVLNLVVPLTFGQATFAINMVFIFLQALMLKGRVPLRIWAQIPVTVVFSFFLDMFMQLFSRLTPQSYPAHLAVLASGMLLLAFGVALQGKARFIKLAGDGIVYVASQVFSKPFGPLKTILDCSLVASSCILSLAALGTIEGVREGTLLSALLTGVLVQFFLKVLRYVPEESGENEGREA